jgi:hypothetical protein
MDGVWGGGQAQPQGQPLLDQPGEAEPFASRQGLGLHQQRVVEIQRGAHNTTSMKICAI